MGSPFFGFGASPSAAAQVVQGMREAAAQQQQMQAAAQAKKTADYQKGLQQDFENHRQLAQEGFVPTQTYPNGGPAPGRPTLQTPEDNPAAQGGGPTVTDPNGQQYTKAKPQLDDTNSFVLSPTAAQAMQEAGYDGIKPGQRIPMAHASTVTEAVKQHLSKNQYDDSNSVVITQAMADKLAPHGISLKPGARVPLEKASSLMDLVKIGEPAEKPDASQIIPGQQGPNGGMLIYDKNSQTAKEVPLPQGSKPVLTPGQQEVNQRFRERQEDKQDAKDRAREDKEQKGRDGAQKTIDTLQTKEQEQHAKRAAYGTALSTKDGEQTVDPDTRQAVTMNAARRKFYQDRYQKATDLAKTYNDQTTKLVQRNGGDTGKPAQSTQQQTQQPAADSPKPAPKTATGQLARNAGSGKAPVTIQHVRNYAKAKGVSEAQAVKEFQGYGYKIGN